MSLTQAAANNTMAKVSPIRSLARNGLNLALGISDNHKSMRTDSARDELGMGPKNDGEVRKGSSRLGIKMLIY